MASWFSTTRRGALAAAALLSVGALLCPVLLRAEPPAAAPLPIGNSAPATLPGLSNLFRPSAKLYNGAQPEGDEGFASLQRLGVRTIISVDGAPPDVARAKRFGMRYVHLPFGYEGCPSPQAARIVRAVRDLPGPVYMHCHHGKNRSPTAAAFARIALDRISTEAAAREMEREGTGKNYLGLYAGVRRYRAPYTTELDAIPAEFPEVSPTPPLVSAMVEIEQRFDRLQAASKAGWRRPRGRPDPDLAHEALLLRELFTESGRTADVRGRPAAFQDSLRASEAGAEALEAALRAGDTPRATRQLIVLAGQCASCHARFRDVPQ